VSSPGQAGQGSRPSGSPLPGSPAAACTGANQGTPGIQLGLFGLTKDDFVDQVKDIITVGEFYDLAAGGQIIFT
jgi:hypothetical protein